MSDLEKLVGAAEAELSQDLTKASPDAAPGSTLGRTLARTAGGVIGGTTGFMLGGMAGGVGAIPGGVAGAGLGTGAGDLAYDLLTGTRRSIPQQAMQTGGALLEGASSEVLGRGIAKAGAPVARALGWSRTVTPEIQANKAAFDKFNIPYLPSDVTGSRALARVENVPSFFSIGVGPMQKHAVGAIRAAESAVGKQVADVGPAVDKITAGIAAQGNVKEAVKQFKYERNVLFDRIQQMAGDEPVIDAAPVYKMAEGLINKAKTGVLPAPAAAQKIVNMAPSTAPAGKVTLGTGKEEMDVSALPEHIQQLFGVAKAQGGKWTFGQARQLETELGQLAFPKGGAPLPNISTGRVRGLYASVRDAQDVWLNEKPQAAIQSGLAEAKQVAAMGQELYNNSMRTLVLGKKVRPETIVNRVFRPGALSDTLDFKLTVKDDVWQKAQAAWLAGVFDSSRTLKSTATGGVDTLSPATFVSKLKPYIGTGQLEAILGPEKSKELVQLYGVIAKMGRSETLAGNPSGTAGAVLSTGQFGALLGAGWKLATGDLPGAAMATGGAMAPLALAKGITSERGKRLALEGLSGKYTKPALRFASHFIGAASDQ